MGLIPKSDNNGVKNIKSISDNIKKSDKFSKE